jgi:hypothetical protein
VSVYGGLGFIIFGLFSQVGGLGFIIFGLFSQVLKR